MEMLLCLVKEGHFLYTRCCVDMSESVHPPVSNWQMSNFLNTRTQKKKKNSLIILIPQTLRQESNITNRALHNLHNSQREKVKAISKFCSSLDRNPSNREEIKSSSNKTHPILAILP